MSEVDGRADDPGCLELLVDNEASDDRRIVITDDFGQRVAMSLDQLRVLVDGVRFGVLDLVAPGG
ncbi:MAG TPA: hypothetical protein VFW65_10160 [Pseudonocardiaceae bacterium]|nr:hypothetical protein [Pseudonocardiaceae bacterium]